MKDAGSTCVNRETGYPWPYRPPNLTLTYRIPGSIVLFTIYFSRDSRDREEEKGMEADNGLSLPRPYLWPYLPTCPQVGTTVVGC